jgi:Right handed beta helix region
MKRSVGVLLMALVFATPAATADARQSKNPKPSPPPPSPAPSPQPPPVTTQTYYVAATGSDTASGSITSPWKTVDRVNQQVLNPGDTVLFRAGDTFADAVLMPPSSGTPGKPVTYGVYGNGRAIIAQGEWSHASYVALRALQFGAQVQAGTNGGVHVSDWSIVNVQILPAPGNQTLGLNYNGDRLTLQQSTIRGTGLSGILMIGDTATITQNTIDNVGLYNIGYNAHGIYLDASNVTVDSNTITRFSASAVSARYRNSTVTHNTIDTGQIGIDFYQTDSVAGKSVWTGNTIRNAASAGIYTTSGDYPLMESFTIKSNTIAAPKNKAAGWRDMNLGKTSGKYAVS